MGRLLFNRNFKTQMEGDGHEKWTRMQTSRCAAAEQNGQGTGIEI